MEEKLQLHTKSSYRYALALFKLVLQEKSEKNTLKDVDNLLSLYKEQKTLEKLFNSPLISAQEQMEIIESLFSYQKENKIQISKNFYAFLMIIAKNARLNILKSILTNFKNMLSSQNKELKIYVTSAIEIKESLKKEMIDIFSNKYATKVVVFNNVDKSILGGLVIRIGSYLIDASISSKISKINSLIKGVSQ